MTRLHDKQLRKLARDFAARVQKDSPEWTGFNESDAGITILEVLAFLGEQLVYRQRAMSARESSVLARVIETLGILRGHGCVGSPRLSRVRYYTGQLLTADDFQAEQDYLRGKLKRHNLCLAGPGVVSGLEVTLGSGSGRDAPVVSVEPGCAIAPDGEDLVLCEPRLCSLSAAVSRGFVTLSLFERNVKPSGARGRIGAAEASRIVEGVAVRFQAKVPPDAVAIARLARKRSVWTIDRDFEPVKAGRK